MTLFKFGIHYKITRCKRASRNVTNKVVNFNFQVLPASIKARNFLTTKLGIFYLYHCSLTFAREAHYSFHQVSSLWHTSYYKVAEAPVILIGSHLSAEALQSQSVRRYETIKLERETCDRRSCKLRNGLLRSVCWRCYSDLTRNI